MYCGATVVVRDAIQAAAAASVPNLLKLARAAAQSSNHQEAYNYFTRVLEVDGTNAEAWSGKAEAAGSMSGQHSFRMPEMINYFRNAIEAASDDQRAEIKDKAAQVICKLISDDYMKMHSALSPAFWENATWIFYLNRVRALITLLEDANKLIPNNNSILKAIIWICDGNSNRIYAQNKFGQRFRGPEFDSQWKAEINNKKRNYTEELHTLNRPLGLPAITNATRDPATAAVSRSTVVSAIDSRLVIIGLGAVLIVGLVLMIVAIAVNQRNTQATRVANQPSPTLTPSFLIRSEANSNKSIQATTPAGTNFATNIVCSLPRQVFPGTPFANLGGGRWAKWGDSGGELDHACEGGTDLIKLKNELGVVDITTEYGPLGNAQSVHYLSAEYTAFQYTGQTSGEKALRLQYADFCERLSEKLYGKRLPEKFKQRLIDESTYAPTGVPNQYAEKIGSGYVRLFSNKNKNMLHLNVAFFPTEGDFRTYKNS